MAIREPKQMPLPPANKTVLSAIEAAAILGLGRSTIYRLLTSKELPSKRIGKRWLVRRVDLDKFVAPETTP